MFIQITSVGKDAKSKPGADEKPVNAADRKVKAEQLGGVSEVRVDRNGHSQEHSEDGAGRCRGPGDGEVAVVVKHEARCEDAEIQSPVKPEAE
jgi:hypothetical protein